MKHPHFQVARKLQEQCGSYFVFLPKLWVQAHGLKESDQVTVTFNGDVHIKATPKSSNHVGREGK